jgi:hypothetical protein
MDYDVGIEFHIIDALVQYELESCPTFESCGLCFVV